MTTTIRFTDTDECKSFVYCPTCRDTGTTGKLWRRVIAKRYGMPNEDWACPHGWKWGGEPGLYLRIKRKLGVGRRFSRVASKLGARPCAPCARRAAKMDGRGG